MRTPKAEARHAPIPWKSTGPQRCSRRSPFSVALKLHVRQLHVEAEAFDDVTSFTDGIRFPHACLLPRIDILLRRFAFDALDFVVVFGPFAFICARTSSPERLTTPTSCPWSASSTTTSPTCTSILEGLRKNPLRFALNRTSTTSNGRWPDGKATPSNQSNTVSDPQPLTPQFPLLRHPRGLPSAPFLQLLQLIEAKIRRFRLPFSAKYSTER